MRNVFGVADVRHPQFGGGPKIVTFNAQMAGVAKTTLAYPEGIQS